MLGMRTQEADDHASKSVALADPQSGKLVIQETKFRAGKRSQQEPRALEATYPAMNNGHPSSKMNERMPYKNK